MTISESSQYQEAANHARHYSTVRVTLVLFFWSATGLLLVQEKFATINAIFAFISLIVGFGLNVYFSICFNICWLYATLLESGENKYELKKEKGLHYDFPKNMSLKKFPGLCSKLFFKDFTNWLQLGITLVFVFAIFLRLVSN